jgi:hypothetical protein
MSNQSDISYPADWTTVSRIEACSGYDRVFFASGGYTTVDNGFVSVGETVRVRRGRLEVKA